MSDSEQRKINLAEVMELIKVWYFLKTGGMVWPGAMIALEDRINQLLEEPKDEWTARKEPVTNN